MNPGEPSVRGGLIVVTVARAGYDFNTRGGVAV